jgi:hypothetical protein
VTRARVRAPRAPLPRVASAAALLPGCPSACAPQTTRCTCASRWRAHACSCALAGRRRPSSSESHGGSHARATCSRHDNTTVTDFVDDTRLMHARVCKLWARPAREHANARPHAFACLLAPPASGLIRAAVAVGPRAVGQVAVVARLHARAARDAAPKRWCRHQQTRSGAVRRRRVQHTQG